MTLDTQPQHPTEPLNHFGLPQKWPKETSLSGLEEIRNKGLSVIRDILLESYNALKTFGGTDTDNTNGIAAFNGLSTYLPGEIDHLFMSMEDRIAHLNKRFPKGLTVMRTNVFVKWEEILPYELWAIQNHGQTLFTLNRRGGLGPQSVVAILFGVHYSNKKIVAVSDDQIIEWLRERGALKG